MCEWREKSMKRIFRIFVSLLCVLQYFAHAQNNVYSGTAYDSPISADWISLAMSTSGAYLSGLTGSNSVYVSDNYGITMYIADLSSLSNNLAQNCMAGSGQFQKAVGKSYCLTTSDYGNNWSSDGFACGFSTVNSYQLYSCSMSLDGSYQLVGGSGQFSYSTNSGSSWNLKTESGANNFISVAISSNGSFLVAMEDQTVYYSTNAGNSWSQAGASSPAQWLNVLVADNGNCIGQNANVNMYYAAAPALSWQTATVNNGGVQVWTSFACTTTLQNCLAMKGAPNAWQTITYGTTWNEITNLPVNAWLVAGNSDFSYIVIADNNQPLQFSIDQGATWKSQAGAPTAYPTRAPTFRPSISIAPSRKPLAPPTSRPTVFPTAQPSKGPFFVVDNFAAFFAGSIGGAALCVMLAVGFVRNNASRQALYNPQLQINTLSAWYAECALVLVQILSFTLVLYSMVQLHDDSGTFNLPMTILILSRSVILGAWVLFVSYFCSSSMSSVQTKDAEDSERQSLVKRVNILTLLNSKVLHSQLNRTIFSLLLVVAIFDCTLLRFFPWHKTKKTDLLEGYPTMAIMQFIVVSSLAAQVLQAVYSILQGMVSNHQQEYYVLLGLSIVNILKNSFSIFLMNYLVKDQNTQLVLIAEEEYLQWKNTGSNRDMESNNDSIIEMRTSTVPVSKDKIIASEKTEEIRKAQLKQAGIVPVEYIPLEKLKAEIDDIINKINAGESYDNDRLDYLMRCLELNPDYAHERLEDTKEWKEKYDPYCQDALEIMRSYVPPHIFSATLSSLTQEDGVVKTISQRLLNKKCLWLVRMPTADIARLHAVELSGKYGIEGQGLDIIEAAAIYACVPERFPNDSDGKKEKWRITLENMVKKMIQEKETHSLPPSKVRNPVYATQDGLFVERNTLHTMAAVKTEAFQPRDSFKSINRSDQAASVAAELIHNTENSGVISVASSSDNSSVPTPRTSRTGAQRQLLEAVLSRPNSRPNSARLESQNSTQDK